MSKPAPALVTTAEASKMLGRSVATVNRWVIAGRITPAMKLPGARGAHLFRLADVERLSRRDAA